MRHSCRRSAPPSGAAPLRVTRLTLVLDGPAPPRPGLGRRTTVPEYTAALQAEAHGVLDDLELLPLLGGVGVPHLVGSARLGLVVWRDVDVTVVCERLDLAAVSDLGGRLPSHPHVREVVLRKEVGRFTTDPEGYPDGVHLLVRHEAPGGEPWKLDVWFVDEPARQPDLRDVATLPARLDRAARDAVLEVEEHWAALPGYGTEVSSADVYRAVLDGGVSSVEEFDAWRAGR